MSKALVTLYTNNYAPNIWRLTRPLFQHHAHKHGYDFIVLDQRKFPDVPCENYEKFQVHEIAQAYDQTLFLDSDCLVHPDCWDLLSVVPMDHVACYGRDLSSTRFKMNRYFERDGRQISACTWCVACSRLTADLWQPMQPGESFIDDVVDNIQPIMSERAAKVFKPEHLCDDYLLSRNIARYGLRYMCFNNFIHEHGLQAMQTLWHNYNIPNEEKERQMLDVYADWGLAPMDA